MCTHSDVFLLVKQVSLLLQEIFLKESPSSLGPEEIRKSISGGVSVEKPSQLEIS